MHTHTQTQTHVHTTQMHAHTDKYTHMYTLTHLSTFQWILSTSNLECRTILRASTVLYQIYSNRHSYSYKTYTFCTCNPSDQKLLGELPLEALSMECFSFPLCFSF